MIIQYGIGKDYLKNWGLQEGLREIYQNFIDFGTFKQKFIKLDNGLTRVILSNHYEPADFEFLQIGKSIKNGNKLAIGQHGEGMKMAFLVFLRLELPLRVLTNHQEITAIWTNQHPIGECLSLNIKKFPTIDKFAVQFDIKSEDFDKFNENLIKPKDILFDAGYHGQKVNKLAGNLYSGRLFICNLNNLKGSYNLSPEVLKLDRDRRVPGSFEVTWHTSKINEAEAKFEFKDQEYDDMKYISKVPEKLLETIKPKIIGNSVKFVASVYNEDTKLHDEVVINNSYMEESLKNNSFFNKAIDKIKRYLVARLGVDDLLIKFRSKYCTNDEARRDFDIILERLGITLKGTDKEELPF